LYSNLGSSQKTRSNLVKSVGLHVNFQLSVAAVFESGEEQTENEVQEINIEELNILGEEEEEEEAEDPPDDISGTAAESDDDEEPEKAKRDMHEQNIQDIYRALPKIRHLVDN
jgi:hypothetical protein